MPTTFRPRLAAASMIRPSPEPKEPRTPQQRHARKASVAGLAVAAAALGAAGKIAFGGGGEAASEDAHHTPPVVQVKPASEFGKSNLHVVEFGKSNLHVVIPDEAPNAEPVFGHSDLRVQNPREGFTPAAEKPIVFGESNLHVVTSETPGPMGAAEVPILPQPPRPR